jgi:hypothetical protein
VFFFPPTDLADLLRRLLAPANFFAGKDITLQWDHTLAEETTWEIFHSRLLDPAHTRLRAVFHSWSVLVPLPPGSPHATAMLLSLKLGEGVLYVVRGLECYVWEGYDAGDNVILSRERRKWTRELIGTIRLEQFPNLAELEGEIACQLFHAVVGTSRLPLSSVEAPHPLFSFGNLLYCYRPWAAGEPEPLRAWQELPAKLLHPRIGWRQRAAVLETFLHNVPSQEMTAAAQLWLRCSPEQTSAIADLKKLLRTLFNEVSLSPWTDLVEKVLAFVNGLEAAGAFTAADGVDFLSHLLRLTGRHLTAYDLVTFHYGGANYPDALLLDLVLKDYLRQIELHPELFQHSSADEEQELRKRLRRRALRQAYLLRRQYEGHPVPDQPTSPGENSRVLPESHPRVPEEQLLNPLRRKRLLYVDDPLPACLSRQAREVLRQSFADLTHAEERRELGLGLFIDRPFGDGKHPAEPDATPLLSSLAFSRAIAERRLRKLADEVGLAKDAPEVLELAAQLDFRGLPVGAIGNGARPGVVTLADARRVSSDFVFLYTTRSTVDALLEMFDFSALAGRFDLDYLLNHQQVLVARRKGVAGVCVYDKGLELRLELVVPPGAEFFCREGREGPAKGLVVVRARQPGPEGTILVHDFTDAPLRVSTRGASGSAGL